jgi:hypothetical protein
VDADAFWALIDRTRAKAAKARRGSVVRRQRKALTKELAALSDDDVRSFRAQLATASARANDWGVWAAGYLAAGGMSDDSFLDFRVWLVHQGREAFERVLADPDALAELSWDDEGEDFADAEELAHVAVELLEKRGLDDDFDGEGSDEPAGEPFPEDDDEWFAARFPRLWARTEETRAERAGWDDDDLGGPVESVTRTGHYAGEEVAGALSPEVIARFRERGHTMLDWSPGDAVNTLDGVLPLAEQLQRLTVYAPGCRDDSALARLTRIRELEAFTAGTNALDVSALTELQELTIADRPGLTGLDRVPLYRLWLRSTTRPLRELEAVGGLRELLIDWEGDEAVEPRAGLPLLEMLVVDARRLGSLAGLRVPALQALVVRIGGQQQVDVSPLAACPGLRSLTVEGPCVLTGVAALAHLDAVTLRLFGGVTLDGDVPAGWTRVKG